MAINANELRIVIRVEEGQVKDVCSDSLAPIRFVIADYDMADGASDDELVTLANGDQFVGLNDFTSMDDSHYVAEVFAALGEISVLDIQQKNYVAGNGQFCPNCGGNNIEANVALDADGASAWGSVGCSDCESTWHDQYRLVGFSDLAATPLKVIKSVSERGYWSNEQGWLFDVASSTKFPKNVANFMPIFS